MESLTIISLGLGVQSTCLYYMSSLGELPRADYAVFADTGKERKATYDYLRYLLSWQDVHNGIPIIICSDRNLFTDLLSSANSSGRRFASIPCFTKNESGTTGMLRRQCTGEYKIAPVDIAIRQLYGLRKGQRRPRTFVWQGWRFR
ncbi:MAG: hypothetical protein J0I41_22750 [Filimonas sp.]|nr:hypothetical protein [Filimonas sp.]